MSIIMKFQRFQMPLCVLPDSDAVTAADIFSGVATDAKASSEKASQVSTTSQTASETATSEAMKWVLVPQQIKFESTTASSEATRTNAHLKQPLTWCICLNESSCHYQFGEPTSYNYRQRPFQVMKLMSMKCTEIKNQPKVSSPRLNLNPGDSVLYDQVVTADGYQWISYKSYSGARAPVKPVAASGNGNSGNGKVSLLMAPPWATTGALNIPATELLLLLHVTQILRKNQADLKPTFVFSKWTMLSMTKFWLRIITNGLTLGMTMFAIMPILRLWHLLKLKHQLLNQQRPIKQTRRYWCWKASSRWYL